ncbi:MAG: phosphoribosylformylglycinamidine synthase I [Halobacteria archaeon]|nr:phosphoribosylformylglycinamidine synthase I [Halobacteria archaeon]
MIGVLQFGGSNCDRDVKKVLDSMGVESELIWYKNSVKHCDGIVLPGGFSYGDYLRAGAIAARAPVMQEVREIASNGKPVLGICNGAQILCESGMAQGAYAQNLSAKFQCEWTRLRVETTDSPFTQEFTEGDTIEIPIAHGEGRYIPKDINDLYSKDKVLFKYVDENGEPTGEANPNGSADNIAGVVGETRNVAAMMPHPERASDELLGSDDGRKILEGMVENALASVTR